MTAVDAPRRFRGVRLGRTGWMLLAAIVLRVGLLVAVHDIGVHTDDERDYVQLAESIETGRGFAYADGRATSMRPPLYPALVAGIWRATGTRSLQVVRAAQIVLSLASVWVLYRLARRLFDEKIAAWSAVAWSLYPSFLYAGVLLLTEVLFTFLLMAGCLCLVLTFVEPAHPARWAFLGGAAIGLAALTRSVAWPLPMILVPVAAVVAPFPVRRRLLVAASLAIGYALIVGPWAVRNTILQKTTVVVDAMGGLNLRMGNYEYTREDRMWDGVSLSGAKSWSHQLRIEHPDAASWTEGQREKWAQQRALSYMRAHPTTTLRRSLLKFGDFWGLEREYIAALRDGKYHPPFWFSTMSSVATIVAYVSAMILGCIGLFGVWHRSNWRLHIVSLLVLAFICGVHTIVFGHSRYHLPVMPIVVMYAASAAVQQPWRRWSGSYWRAVPATAAIAGLLVIWAHEVLFRDPQRIRQFWAAGGL